MTLSHAEVVKAFSEFRRAPGARMRSVVLDDNTAVLVGFDWAVYAVYFRYDNSERDGRIIVFRGWKEYSPTSSGHIGTVIWELEGEVQFFVDYVHMPEFLCGGISRRDRELIEALRKAKEGELYRYYTAEFGSRMPLREDVWLRFDGTIEATDRTGKESVAFYSSESHKKLFDEFIINKPSKEKLDYLSELVRSPIWRGDSHLHFDWRLLRKTIRWYKSYYGNQENAKKMLWHNGKRKAVILPSIRKILLVAPDKYTPTVTVYHIRDPSEKARWANMSYNTFYQVYIRGNIKHLKKIEFTESGETGLEVIKEHAHLLDPKSIERLPDSYKALVVSELL